MIFDSIFYTISNRRILNGIFLKVEPGKICGIFGRNGSGKSTLMKIGAGMISPASGITFIDGQAFISKSRIKRFENIAYLCQDTVLPEVLTARKFIESNPVNKNCDYIYNNFNSELLDQNIGELSGGELRFLELLLILSLDRLYILLDEPFTGVEPKTIDKMIDLITQERDKGKGILITDHYHRYISQIADLAYLLKNSECYFLGDNSSLKFKLQEFDYLK